MITETIDLDPKGNTEPPKPTQDVHAPLNPLDIRLNFNCMLYLFTEMMTLFNELVLIMKDKEQITEEEIGRIFQTTTDKDALLRVYQAVFRRFMEYYVATKEDVTGEKPQTVVPNFGARNENSATKSETVVSSKTTVVQEPNEITE